VHGKRYLVQRGRIKLALARRAFFNLPAACYVRGAPKARLAQQKARLHGNYYFSCLLLVHLISRHLLPIKT
jgi:hypothetical protein